jgi:hypothetical protein
VQGEGGGCGCDDGVFNELGLTCLEDNLGAMETSVLVVNRRADLVGGSRDTI